MKNSNQFWNSFFHYLIYIITDAREYKGEFLRFIMHYALLMSSTGITEIADLCKFHLLNCIYRDSFWIETTIRIMFAPWFKVLQRVSKNRNYCKNLNRQKLFQQNIFIWQHSYPRLKTSRFLRRNCILQLYLFIRRKTITFLITLFISPLLLILLICKSSRNMRAMQDNVYIRYHYF